MRRRLLVICKEPEFDIHGEVVLGQCEPFTSGWNLILYDSAGPRETLATGTYSDLRRIQESCAGIDDLGILRRRVESMRALMFRSVTETVAVAQNAPPAASAHEPIHSPGGLLELQRANGVLVATVVQPERAADADFLKQELQSLLNGQPRALLLDFSRVAALTHDGLHELAVLRDNVRARGGSFALCNVAGAARQALNALPAAQALPVFDSLASALAALSA